MVSFAYNILSEIMQIRSHLHFLLNLLQTTIKRKGPPYGDCEDPVEYFKNHLVRYTTQVCAFILLKKLVLLYMIEFKVLYFVQYYHYLLTIVFVGFSIFSFFRISQIMTLLSLVVNKHS